MPLRPCLSALAAAVLLSACAAGPDFVRPSLPMPGAYKEAGDWKPAEPRPAASGLAWWQAYGDPVLDGLEADADRANQDIRQAEAAWRQAKALADADRAGLFPSLGLDAGAQRARSNANGVRTGDAYTLGLAASWEPDLWGSVRRQVEAGSAGAQASADDLAAARLSIQTTLAQDYLQLRVADQQRDLYASTVEAYGKALELTRAQHAAGVALQSDVALAQAQLAQAQAATVDLEATRAQLEHAIAVLTGRAPAQFALAARPAGQPLALAMPATPAGLPSALLEHRPDIAAAERRAAAANAQIGVAKAAYFPQLTLGASGGFSAAALGSLFDTPAHVWSLGAALAQTLFDGGLRGARTAQAEAGYDAAVAQYKQAVLGGFQQVEDQLALLRLLDQEAMLQDQAVRASRQAEQLALAQYRAGTASYLGVVTAQTLSLNNQRSAVQLRGRLVAASIALVAATGGGWSVTDSTAVAATPATPQ
ncbi:MAG: efflux transporter outer membrane subunit [Burkholderiales bacterium]|nr:efflux transporter outer membrane subunit [Burkholderiales bacterium]